MEENTVTELVNKNAKLTKVPIPRLVVTDIPAPQFASLIASETVVLVVGPKRKRFSAHKDLLCHMVPYFEKAFNGTFTQTMYFAKADPAAMELFIGWLYRGAASLIPTDDNSIPLLRLYVVAVKWCLPVLQNSITNNILDWLHSKEPVKRLKAVKSIIEGCWDEIQNYDGPTDAIAFVTIDLTKHSSIDIRDVHDVVELNDDFAEAFAAAQHWTSKAPIFGREVIGRNCQV
ncbi:hypothetical protein MMC27_004717 [Xylographa pallens]|nr:hypothetical protein [Xylographa pallens]